MKIFGHKLIQSEIFYNIDKIEDISETPNNSTIYTYHHKDNFPLQKNLKNRDLNIANYCKKNSINYAIRVENIKEALFFNLLNPKYIIIVPQLAIKLVKIAQNYLFDTQILANIKDDSQITEMAEHNVDGVIFLQNSIVVPKTFSYQDTLLTNRVLHPERNIKLINKLNKFKWSNKFIKLTLRDLDFQYSEFFEKPTLSTLE